MDDHSYYYNIYKFNEEVYKVVRLNGRPCSHKGGFCDPEKVVHYDKKLSRAYRALAGLFLSLLYVISGSTFVRSLLIKNTMIGTISTSGIKTSLNG